MNQYVDNEDCAVTTSALEQTEMAHTFQSEQERNSKIPHGARLVKNNIVNETEHFLLRYLRYTDQDENFRLLTDFISLNSLR